MLRVYHLVLGAILLALTPVGVKTILPNFSTEVVENPNSVVETTHSTPSQTTTGITSSTIEGNTWQKILGKTPTPKGWEVVPCQVNPSLLCVSSQGKLLGTVEIGVYPVKENQKFQKNLTDAGIPLGSQLDYQSPDYQNKLLIALQTWVADFNASFVKDRRDVHGNKIIFSAYPPQPALVGKLQGIRYGLVGLSPEGGVEELHISHVTFDGTAIYVMTTAFGADSVTGKFEQLENLAIFQGYFSAIASNLKLPM